MTTNITEEAKVHVFESAGLGKAPFKFVHMTIETYQACPGAPIQPGGSCDYCGHPIKQMYHIQSSDGKEFKVGCDCVEKTGDKGLKKQIDKKKREVAREKRREQYICTKEAILKLRSDYDLTKLPHPNHFMADKGLTLDDWLTWMFNHAGNAGLKKTYNTLLDILEKEGLL